MTFTEEEYERMREESRARERADFDTIKPRSVKINLSDMQLKDLKEIVSDHNLGSVASLLGAFVADLTGHHSNGSDEEEHAQDWFDRYRCNF